MEKNKQLNIISVKINAELILYDFIFFALKGRPQKTAISPNMRMWVKEIQQIRPRR